eukprot:1393708-Pyramimonas_sp.AAC.1
MHAPLTTSLWLRLSPGQKAWVPSARHGAGWALSVASPVTNRSLHVHARSRRCGNVGELQIASTVDCKYRRCGEVVLPGRKACGWRCSALRAASAPPRARCAPSCGGPKGSWCELRRRSAALTLSPRRTRPGSPSAPRGTGRPAAGKIRWSTAAARRGLARSDGQQLPHLENWQDPRVNSCHT